MHSILKEIDKDLMYGNWEEAKIKFQALNISNSEYSDYLKENIRRTGLLKDLALLGFHSREFNPKK